jgi:hypothetical protein
LAFSYIMVDYFQQFLQVALHRPVLEVPEGILVLQRIVGLARSIGRRILKWFIPFSYGPVFQFPWNANFMHRVV